MRIHSCYIENFGKLHQVSFSLDPHLTVLVENNGWGKSTLAAFIKAMFYGMDYKPRAKLTDSERKRYRPWQAGSFGGSLVFEQNGKCYRVERNFGNKASEDSFALYDEQTGMLSEDFSSNLGEELFAVDQVSYGYTTYLAQNCHEIQGTDQIFALLTQESGQSGEKDMDSYTDAVKRLKEEAKQYKKTGGRGSIDVTINRITRAEQELRSAQAQVASYEEWSGRLKECGIRIAEEKQKLLEDKKLVEQAGSAEGSRARLEQLDSLKKRQKGLKLQLDEIAEHFPALDEESMQRYEQDLAQQLAKAKKLAGDRQAAASRQTQFDTLSMMPVVVEEPPEEDSQEIPVVTGNGLVWAVLAGLSAAATLLAGILVTPLALIGLLLSAVFLLLYIRSRKQTEEYSRQQKEQQKVRKQQLWQQRKQQAEEQRCRELDSYRQALRQLHQDCEEQEQGLVKALAGYHVREQSNLETAFVMLQEMLKNAFRLSRELGEVTMELEALTAYGSEEDLREAARTRISMEQAQRQQKQDEEALYQLLEEEKDYRSQLLRLEGAEEQVRDLTEEIEALRTRLGEEEKRYDCIETACRLLEEARERYSNRYADPVKKSFEQYAAKLGFSGDEQPCMDSGLSIAVKAAGMQRETEYFSKGTRDLLWLCARIAVVESVFIREKPVLVLDDPFTELDQEHNQRAQDVVKGLSENYQILYMTCHESRASDLI